MLRGSYGILPWIVMGYLDPVWFEQQAHSSALRVNQPRCIPTVVRKTTRWRDTFRTP